jgi:hypothetical protein
VHTVQFEKRSLKREKTGDEKDSEIEEGLRMRSG